MVYIQQLERTISSLRYRQYGRYAKSSSDRSYKIPVKLMV